jgi:hypothetical protein
VRTRMEIKGQILKLAKSFRKLLFSAFTKLLCFIKTFFINIDLARAACLTKRVRSNHGLQPVDYGINKTDFSPKANLVLFNTGSCGSDKNLYGQTKTRATNLFLKK